MKVFTQEWIQQARDFVDRKSTFKPVPFHYVLALAEQLSDLREQIEQWVELFPIETQRILISRLQSRNAGNSLNELRFGAKLMEAGCNIRYEPNLSGLTPDWLVTNSGSSFIVEVVTASYSGVQNDIWENISDLIGRLQEVLVPYAVAVTVLPSAAVLNEETNKKLAEYVNSWLTSTPTSVGDSQTWLNTEFRIVNYNPSYSRLQVVGPGHSWMVDKQFLKRKLLVKIDKYRAVAQQLNFPLIIAVASNFKSSLGLDDLEDVLYGQEMIVYMIDREGDPVGPSRLSRAWGDGLFLQEPYLSAVLWLNESRPEDSLKLIHNPHATHPIGHGDLIQEAS